MPLDARQSTKYKVQSTAQEADGGTRQAKKPHKSAFQHPHMMQEGLALWRLAGGLSNITLIRRGSNSSNI
jgi:hypothetical protein